MSTAARGGAQRVSGRFAFILLLLSLLLLQNARIACTMQAARDHLVYTAVVLPRYTLRPCATAARLYYNIYRYIVCACFCVRVQGGGGGGSERFDIRPSARYRCTFARAADCAIKNVRSSPVRPTLRGPLRRAGYGRTDARRHYISDHQLLGP